MDPMKKAALLKKLGQPGANMQFESPGAYNVFKGSLESAPNSEANQDSRLEALSLMQSDEGADHLKSDFQDPQATQAYQATLMGDDINKDQILERIRFKKLQQMMRGPASGPVKSLALDQE